MSSKKTYFWTFGIILFFAGSIIYFRWSSRILQPLEFSHTTHVKQKIPCSACHFEASDELPSVALCADCHKDRSFPREVSWVRVYRVAPDIIFGHREHTNFSCGDCHEQMTRGARWIHEARFEMDFCTICHQQKGAQNECRTCHENR